MSIKFGTAITLILLSNFLISCDHKTDNIKVEIKDELGIIIINNNDVTVEPSHIASIKPERYQPSLTLYGQLLPIQYEFIDHVQKLKLLNIHVKQDEIVQKDQTLVTAKPVSSIEQLTHSNNNIKIKAPFSGTIQHIYYNQDRIIKSFYPTIVGEKKPIMILTNTEGWQFFSLLPQYTKSKLSIGQHVNFSIMPNPNTDQSQFKLTGQISDIKTHNNNKELSVNVHLVSNDVSDTLLRQGMFVQGKVDYGQIEVGTLISKVGVHEITSHDTYGGLATDLSVFSRQHSHIVAPVKAYVWIVKHDRRLTRKLVDVISYNSQTNQYLVAGIPNESLICLVDLPSSSEGKLLRVS